MTERDAPATTCIPLSRGKYALVDADDLPRLDPFRWHASYEPDTERWFAKRGERTGTGRGAPVRTIWMHRFILDAPAGMRVDHINGDGLDNRKANLRLCTAQQMLAKRRRNRNSTSGYRGVSWHATNGKWRASLGQGKKQELLGYFATQEEAARAYDAAAREAFGAFAYQNFPGSDP